MSHASSALSDYYIEMIIIPTNKDLTFRGSRTIKMMFVICNM